MLVNVIWILHLSIFIWCLFLWTSHKEWSWQNNFHLFLSLHYILAYSNTNNLIYSRTLSYLTGSHPFVPNVSTLLMYHHRAFFLWPNHLKVLHFILSNTSLLFPSNSATLLFIIVTFSFHLLHTHYQIHLPAFVISHLLESVLYFQQTGVYSHLPLFTLILMQWLLIFEWMFPFKYWERIRIIINWCFLLYYLIHTWSYWIFASRWTTQYLFGIILPWTGCCEKSDSISWTLPRRSRLLVAMFYLSRNQSSGIYEYQTL